MSPLTQTKRQIYLPGGNGTGGYTKESSALRVISTEVPAATVEAGSAVIRKNDSEAPAATIESALVKVMGAKETPAPTIESSKVDIYTWAASQATSGTAPTTPANGLGAPDGQLATVKAGGVANGTSGLTLTIPRASIPAKTLKTYSYYLRPNGDISGTGTNPAAAWIRSGTASGTLPIYPAIAETVTPTAAPDTDSILSNSAAAVTYLGDLSTQQLPVDETMQGVRLWFNWVANTNRYSFTMELRKADGTVLGTFTRSLSGTGTPAAQAWDSITYTGALTQSEIDGLRFAVTQSGTGNQSQVFAVTAEVFTVKTADLGSSASYELLVYYKITKTGTGDQTNSYTVTYTDTGGNPQTFVLPGIGGAGPYDYLTVPYKLTLTALHPTNDITVSFVHTSVAPGADGGTIQVDAAGIHTIGAL